MAVELVALEQEGHNISRWAVRKDGNEATQVEVDHEELLDLLRQMYAATL